VTLRFLLLLLKDCLEYDKSEIADFKQDYKKAHKDYKTVSKLEGEYFEAAISPRKIWLKNVLRKIFRPKSPYLTGKLK
jgi:hypothetical protein